MHSWRRLTLVRVARRLFLNDDGDLLRDHRRVVRRVQRIAEHAAAACVCRAAASAWFRSGPCRSGCCVRSAGSGCERSAGASPSTSRWWWPVLSNLMPAGAMPMPLRPNTTVTGPLTLAPSFGRDDVDLGAGGRRFRSARATPVAASDERGTERETRQVSVFHRKAPWALGVQLRPTGTGRASGARIYPSDGAVHRQQQQHRHGR